MKPDAVRHLIATVESLLSHDLLGSIEPDLEADLWNRVMAVRVALATVKDQS